MATPKRGITVKDVSAADFIAAYAKFLKRSGKVEVPKWVDVVKTGKHKELAPYNPDWYFVRTAAVARKVYLNQGIGMGDFKTIFGGAYRRGARPRTFSKGSGAVIRSILHNLENMKVVEKDPKSGRRISTTGQRDLDRIAGNIVNKPAPK